MTRRHKAMAIAAVALFTSCAHRPPVDRGIIVIAIANGPTNFDPGVGLDEMSQKLHQLIYSSLVRLDDHLRVVPDLAIRFESPDPLTYVAEVRHDVRFSDGRELTAVDVAYTFGRFLDPAFVSGRKGAYRMLASVDVVDRYTVAFHLKEASSSFPINLVMGIVPAGIGAAAARAPIGSGPYRLAEFAADDHATLVPSATYFGDPPKNTGLTFKVVPDDTMRGLELRKGSVDLVINDISPDVVRRFQEEGRLHVVTTPGTDYAYIGFNLTDPILADRRVRMAIGYAVDTDAIVKYLRRGLAEPAVGIMPPMSWAFEPAVFRFTRDLAKARALLDDAGYPDRGAPGHPFRLKLTLKTSTADAYRLQAAVIQQNLAEIGIAIDVRSYEFATLFADVLKGNAQLYTLQWVGVTDPDMLRRVFHSSQMPPSGFNRGRYRNVEVDHLIDAASMARSDADRRRLYGDVERAVAADAPYISLWYKTNVAVFQPDINGVTLSPVADFSFLKSVWRK